MFGILGAMEPEVAQLSRLITDCQIETIAGMRFWRGQLEGQPVVLLQCGIGKVNAAIGCSLLLEHYQVSQIINTGSAGGLLPTQTFGDLVISSSVIHHDVDVTAFGYASGQVPGHPVAYAADEPLMRLAERALDQLRARAEIPTSVGHTRGVIGSGDIFVHTAETIARLRQVFPHLCAVEMESAAVAQTCHVFGVPFVIIRALSDIAGQESPLKFDEFLPIAAHHSCLLVREMLRQFTPST